MNKNSEKLVLDYIPLANKIAWQKSQSTPRHISFDDLKSAAYLGLVEAASRFKIEMGSFSNYASIRISGAIKDHLRSSSRRDKLREVEESDFFALNSVDTTEEFFDFVSSKLDSYEGKIIKMYYVERKTLKEIGKDQGLCESRVSQIIGRCHKRLRKSLV